MRDRFASEQMIGLTSECVIDMPRNIQSANDFSGSERSRLMTASVLKLRTDTPSSRWATREKIRNKRISDAPVRPAAQEGRCPAGTVLELSFD
jgi:hypothetical protein